LTRERGTPSSLHDIEAKASQVENKAENHYQEHPSKKKKRRLSKDDKKNKRIGKEGEPSSTSAYDEGGTGAESAGPQHLEDKNK